MSPTLNKATWTLSSKKDSNWNCKGSATSKKLAWVALTRKLNELDAKPGSRPDDLKFTLMPKENNPIIKVQESRIVFCLQNLKAAKEVAGGMRVGEMNIGEAVFPAILQRIVYGFANVIQEKKLNSISISLIKQKPDSRPAKMGFDKLLIRGNCFQLYAFVNKKITEEIFKAL